MDAVEFLKEKKRMCDNFGFSCSGCPLGVEAIGDSCLNWLSRMPANSVEIVEKWSNENPVVTNGTKFLEVFGITLTEALGQGTRWLYQEYIEQPLKKEGKNEK